jgi:hypothetical protein
MNAKSNWWTVSIEPEVSSRLNASKIAESYSRINCYGTEIAERTAYFVDRLLRNSRPGDLPVEEATRFKLVINLRTANSLGIKIPQSILQRADEVIR